MKKYISIISIIIVFLSLGTLKAQEKDIDIDNLSRKEIMAFTYDDLLDLPFGELKKMAEKLGVSADELLKLALNREVSTASKKGESVFESPLSTTVISKEEIELTGATTYEELFRLVPGMIVRQESNGNFDVHIRGNDNLPPGNFSHFSENTISLVMVDGRIVYNYINGGTIWESLPVAMADIDRIEIIRGASSALYGPNAVSGVINIITKTPNKEGVHANGNMQIGNNNSYLGSFSMLNKVNKNLGIKLSGSVDYRERFQKDFFEYLSGEYVPADSLTSMFVKDLNAKSPDPGLSKKAYSGNAGIFYDFNPDFNMSLNTGMQHSEAQLMFFENLATPFGIRESTTGYGDVKINAYGLQAQVNYLAGRQDLHQRMAKPVIEYDMNYLSANVEYDLVLNELGIGELTLRPGFNYQLANYDDEPYVRKIDTTGPLDMGILNGNKKLSTISGNLRIDYRPISDLRFIAALRADQYDVPDEMYFSWQFVAAYNINSKHLIRAVYSRANRSAFIANNYANFKNPLGATWNINPATGDTVAYIQQYYQSYIGNENLELMTQDLYEAGYRGIFTDWLQFDLEGFYSITKNFDALFPVNLETRVMGAYMGYPALEIEDDWQYNNIELESTQMGGTFTVNIQPLDNLLLKIFGTYQQTTLTNYVQDFSDIYDANNAGGEPGSYPEDIYSDGENTWTPSFYGGFMINYAPIQKLNFNASAYFYSKQVYSRYFYEASTNTHTSIEETINPNVIINLKSAYRVTDNAAVFINARNLLNHSKTEFAYNDRINGLYLVGIDFNF